MSLPKDPLQAADYRRKISQIKRAHPVRYWLGKKRSRETIEKLRISKLGSVPWNKGLTGIYSSETRRKMREAPRLRGPLASNWKGGLPHCIDCGRTVWYYSKRCQKCDIKHKHSLRGPRARTWKGGVTPVMLIIRHCLKTREWRQAIFTRDNYTCKECGCRGGGILHADHYPVTFAEIIHKYRIRTLAQAERCAMLWDTNNGRTLCESCHRKRHGIMKRSKPKPIKQWKEKQRQLLSLQDAA